ncbi:MAG: asparagine synthase [Flavipsychrobacter sp.]|nr:asparagine synthase [Flavipsychrobacter sp.]
MCGIAGLYGEFAPDATKKAITALNCSLAHRGPDGNGVFQADGIALVHTRLSIIDLSENGNQPLYNEDRSLVLICNGELYNYKELTADLINKGHRFSSNSDCEVILHLYEDLSGDLPKLLNMLTGMFAFALWDIKRQQLFIARDRIGIKPFYYSYDNGKLVFASEVKPVAETGLVDAAIDYTSLYEYFLTGSIPAPNTLYKGVKSLEQGHFMVLGQGKMSVQEYWDIPKGVKKWNSEEEVNDAVETLLSEVVKDHLVADVPVGTFLSAGVDSSLITAMAVAHHPGIHSFTASFPGEPEDEGNIATATAKKLQTTHHTFELRNDFFSDFSEQFKDIDQPFAISSALSLGRISAMAREHVKVVLSGDGADELFGGYNRHEAPVRPDFLKKIPQALQNDVLKIGAKLTGKKSLEALRANLAVPDGEAFFIKTIIAEPKDVLSLFSETAKKEIDTGRYIRRLDALFAKRKGEDELNRVLYVDMKTTLVDEMLTKCDRMTMINGVEGRVPFLDHRLVELAFSIPACYKRKNGTGKIILRELLAKRLGRDLAYRVKTGFNAPLQQWLNNDDQTIAFVKKEFSNAGRLTFIDKQTIETYAKKIGAVRAGVVFSVVCLSHFLIDESINSNK